jgi:hypothetical protein
MAHAPERTINRYYDPSTGQFVSVDPMVNETNQPYLYAEDDPVNGVDPLGLSLWKWVKHNAGAIIAGAAFVTAVAVVTVTTAGIGDVVLVTGAAVGEDAVATEASETSVSEANADTGQRGAGITVIGPIPQYLTLANELGANYFSVPEEAWRALSPEEQWAMNQQFLDDAIARGDTFILAQDAESARAGSFFEKEIQYLLSRGYAFEDGNLVPPETGTLPETSEGGACA